MPLAPLPPALLLPWLFLPQALGLSLPLPGLALVLSLPLARQAGV